LHIRLINNLQNFAEDGDERSTITYAVVANKHQFGDAFRLYPDHSDQWAFIHIERRLPFRGRYIPPLFVAVALDNPYRNLQWIFVKRKSIEDSGTGCRAQQRRRVEE